MDFALANSFSFLLKNYLLWEQNPKIYSKSLSIHVLSFVHIKCIYNLQEFNQGMLSFLLFFQYII